MKEIVLMQVKTQKKGMDVELRLNLENYDKLAQFQVPETGETARVRLKHWSDEGTVIGYGIIGGKNLRIRVGIALADWKMFDEKCSAVKAEHFAQAEKLKVVAFIYQMGCDAPSAWEFEYEENDFPYDAMEHRSRMDKRLIKVARKLDLNKLAKEYGAQQLEATYSTHYGLRFEGRALDRLMVDLQKGEADIVARKAKEAAARKERDEEREEAKKEFDVSVIRVSYKQGGEGGPDPFADVILTDPVTGESGKFCCRNIFDFGYVVNPEGGGLNRSVESLLERAENEEEREFFQNYPTETGRIWELPGENQWRAVTDFEIRALKYLSRFSPIERGIRM